MLSAILGIMADYRKAWNDFWQSGQITEMLGILCFRHFRQFRQTTEKPRILCFWHFPQFRQIYRKCQNCRKPARHSDVSVILADLPGMLERPAFGNFGISGKYVGTKIVKLCLRGVILVPFIFLSVELFGIPAPWHTTKYTIYILKTPGSKM